jgi:hypothetical protein
LPQTTFGCKTSMHKPNDRENLKHLKQKPKHNIIWILAELMLQE